MDFDAAAQRLARDQATRGNRRIHTSLGSRRHMVSAKVQHEAQRLKEQQENFRKQKEAKQRQFAHQEKYMERWNTALGVLSLQRSSPVMTLQPTSIHGQGDKISLPPSVLEYLTSEDSSISTTASPSPWTFRIGIRNPEYSFPASPQVRNLVPNNDALEDDEDDGNQDALENSTSHNEDEDHQNTEPYLDELRHQYLVYTHGTVVEFTQEPGHVGLPEPISKVLLDPSRQRPPVMSISTIRTVDPAAVGETAMVDCVNAHEQTPGHLAYGAFDIPNLPVEVTLVQLPKGRACTLIPTPQAVQAGFYHLKDVKLVLEQSLMRTRATLTTGDVIYTWHRGVQYNVVVASVTPATYGAVSCINTDIEVVIGASGEEEIGSAPSGSPLPSSRASKSRPVAPKPPTGVAGAVEQDEASLRPEPTLEVSLDRICTLQIRAPDGVTCRRRRMDIHEATVQDVFALARTALRLREEIKDTDGRSADSDGPFRLVTRFPRRVVTLEQSFQTLAEAGFGAGQEFLLIERFDQGNSE